MILQFVDRDGKLKALNRLLNEKSPSLVLLYGGRRVGKTRVVQEFLKGKRCLYLYVPNAEEKTILAEFSGVVGMMVKRIEGKKKMRAESFVAPDLQEVRGRRPKSAWKAM
jgi:AAA+ ATPase superfamily predicted ATPase